MHINIKGNGRVDKDIWKPAAIREEYIKIPIKSGNKQLIIIKNGLFLLSSLLITKGYIKLLPFLKERIVLKISNPTKIINNTKQIEKRTKSLFGSYFSAIWKVYTNE